MNQETRGEDTVDREGCVGSVTPTLNPWYERGDVRLESGAPGDFT